MKATRAAVYKAIDTERDYQDAGRGNAKRHAEFPEMTPGEFILAMERYIGLARDAWAKPDGATGCLAEIRKVTALGVRCMEVHGAPERKT